jgi:hypothetical protein
MVQNKVSFFQGDQWENNDDTLSLPRGYLIAILTVGLSLVTSSFGFWRECCIKDKFDDLFPILLSVNAISWFFCFILFCSFRVSFRKKIFVTGKEGID